MSSAPSVESFLDRLLSTPRGRIFAANMYATFTQGLVPPEQLREFLGHCAEALDKEPSANAMRIAEDVSCGENADRKRYLRQCRMAPFGFGDKQLLSNTINSVSFHTFLLSDDYKDGSHGLPVTLPLQPVDSASGLGEYRDRLLTVVADSAWKKPNATIGKPLPAPSNCWISSDHFGPDPSAPKYPDDSATKARDELGLIDSNEGSFLLRLSFPAEDLAGISGHEMARPSFADLGNSRFCVHQTSVRATTFAANGWGATTHLGKFGNPAYADYTGNCERVSSALPIADLRSLTVEFLGKVTSNAGVEAHNNDDAYAHTLLAGQTEASIKKVILKLIED